MSYAWPFIRSPQLTLMCRLASGAPPGLYGPNREEMQQLMAGMKAAKAAQPASAVGASASGAR